MKLAELLEGLTYETAAGSTDREVTGLAYDSRKVAPGDVFFCIRGLQTDGHKYAAQAAAAGAVALVCEEAPEGLPENVAVIVTPDSRVAMAQAADTWCGHPTEQLRLVGITGTNGKTTTTYLLRSILMDAGRKTGVIGTIGNMVGDKMLHAEHTTPESLDLSLLMREMVDAGVQDVFMEVSSHALALHRVDGCRYRVGVFTNLTQDHLDYHKTMENYKQAKGLLFARCEKAVVNADDEAGAYMAARCPGEVLTYAIDRPADLRAEQVEITAAGVSFQLDYAGKQWPVRLAIPGKFSVYNALGAIGACLHLGVPMETILQGLSENRGVPGRFQTIPGKHGFNAIVDYAHTPDGLENILKTAREFTKGRIITVFGCGGDRDRTKRPIMGKIAGTLSDYCVITSDNPRTENPETILLDVEVGMQRTSCEYEKELDRRKAIFRAVELARPGDLVVVAGKGHEDYQIFADRTIHFDDVEVVKEALQ